MAFPSSSASRFSTVARLFVSVLALAALVSGTRAAAGDDDIVSEFKKYFRQYKDQPTRVEAVMSLDGVDTPSVVEVLVPVLKLAEEPDVVRAAITVLSKVKSDAAKQALFGAFSDESDDLIRSGLLQVITKGKLSTARWWRCRKGCAIRTEGGKCDACGKETYESKATDAIALMLTDKSWDLRRRAIEALAASGDTTQDAPIEPLCKDGEVAVRCAAIEALAALKSPKSVPNGIALLNDESWQVRSSAILALKIVRHRDSIEPLIKRLEIEEGRLTADIGAALNEITAKSFGMRLDMWQQFWTTYKDRFQIPTDAELAALRQKQKEEAEKYKPTNKSTTYYGIDTPSRRILFIIDVSGSMENLVVEKERFKDGNYPSFLRIDICKTELIRTIQSLEDYVEFNVIAFATHVKEWKKGLVKANVLNKSSAMEWVRGLQAIGGASKEDLAQAGLTGSANLDAGKTNTHGALITGLGAGGRTRAGDYEVEVDTIFFLSDGRPTVGEYVDPKDVLREIRDANKVRKIVIHTIAIGEFQKDFMKQLADENGGIFVDLGK